MPQLIFEHHMHVGVVKYAGISFLCKEASVILILPLHCWLMQNDKDHQEHMERFYLDAALKQQAQKIHDIFQLWSSSTCHNNRDLDLP